MVISKHSSTRIRLSEVRVRGSGSVPKCRGSGSVPKCHGSATVQHWLIWYKVIFAWTLKSLYLSRECHDVQISVKKIPKEKAALRNQSKKSVQIAANSAKSAPVRQDIRTLHQKRVSIYTSSEEEDEEKVRRPGRSSDLSVAPAAASPALHPNSKHGVEILGEFFSSKESKEME
jgi:hypothetical protein